MIQNLLHPYLVVVICLMDGRQDLSESGLSVVHNLLYLCLINTARAVVKPERVECDYSFLGHDGGKESVAD